MKSFADLSAGDRRSCCQEDDQTFHDKLENFCTDITYHTCTAYTLHSKVVNTIDITTKILVESPLRGGTNSRLVRLPSKTTSTTIPGMPTSEPDDSPTSTTAANDFVFPFSHSSLIVFNIVKRHFLNLDDAWREKRRGYYNNNNLSRSSFTYLNLVLRVLWGRLVDDSSPVGMIASSSRLVAPFYVHHLQIFF